MTRVVFETATIADTIKKAERIAPGKGAAFDKAAGIVMEINPGISIIVRATNTEVYYMEWVDSIEVEGEPAVWRIPSRVFAGVVASLPIGSGKTVTFETKPDVNRRIHMTSGRTKAQFNLIASEYYPVWTAFDPDGLKIVTDLGGRLLQVEWAASKGMDIPYNGVHFNGESCVATDRYRCAMVPLEMPLDQPITIPANILTPVLKQTGDMWIGTEGNQLLLMPDEHTQVRAITYAGEYPNIKRALKRDQPTRTTVKKTEVLEIMSRALNLAGSDRIPTMRVFIGAEELAVMITNEGLGLLGDVVELAGQADHVRVEFKFTPKNIMDALEASPNESVTLAYDPTQPSKMFYLDGGSGYEAWVQPRLENA